MAAPRPQAWVSPELVCSVGYQSSTSFHILEFHASLQFAVISSLVVFVLMDLCLLSFLCCRFSSVSKEVDFLNFLSRSQKPLVIFYT